jgi:hypothetical protein
LAIASILLLLCFTLVNSNNNHIDQMERTLFDKRLTTKTTMEHLYDLLNENNLYDENTNVFIRSLAKPFPDRRSSFHAMRGKRRII